MDKCRTVLESCASAAKDSKRSWCTSCTLSYSACCSRRFAAFSSTSAYLAEPTQGLSIRSLHLRSTALSRSPRQHCSICEMLGTHLHTPVDYELMRQPVHKLWPLKFTLPHQHLQLLVVPLLRLPTTQPLQNSGNAADTSAPSIRHTAINHF